MSFPSIDFLGYLPELADVPIETIIDDLLAGFYPIEKNELIIRYLVKSGFRFSSPDQLQHLREKLPVYLNGMTFAHAFASCGYPFTVDQIMALDNHADDHGTSIAHHMVYARHTFSVDELLQLGNPVNFRQETVAHWMAVFQGHQFSPDEIMALGNPVDRDSSTLDKVLFLHRPPQPNLSGQGVLMVNGMTTPIFAITKDFAYLLTNDQFGYCLEIAFGFCDGNWDFHTYDSFSLAIKHKGDRWGIELSEGEPYNEFVFKHLYWKIAILHLAEMCDQAIAGNQDLDFTEYELFLRYFDPMMDVAYSVS